MRKARLIETRDVPIDEIDVGERLRYVSAAALEGLEASVDDLGVVLDEIHLRRVRHQGNKLKLMAGGHRLALADRKGWNTIRAKIWDCSDDWAALVEVDDNLAHAELSPIELARFLAKRKAVYEKLHPEAKAGVAGGKARHGLAADIMSFAASVAEKRDLSERHVRRLIAAGEALTEEMVADLNVAQLVTKRPVGVTDLMALSKLDDPEERRRAVWTFCNATTLPTLKKAIAYSHGADKPAKDPVEDGFNALMAAWKRAPAAARRRFVSDAYDELSGLTSDEYVRRFK